MNRLFVAIALPDAVRQHLALLGGGVPGARWVAPETMHVTLRFIGEVDGIVEDDIAAALAEVYAEPFALTVSGVGDFEQGSKPKTIWAGVLEREVLTRLHEKIERQLALIGVREEGRKFHPHVTLARLRGAWRDRVAQFLAEHHGFVAAPFTVATFHLLSSHRGARGPVYRVEATYPLGG
ncbi:MAG: RNA 2',3'-cyclic phosphodiesterase [Alphaproteobacteria bacterium]|nr:RNA 2',3'-cyclic phosphodiesterase [Alphaproteobacteria bacterium]